MKPMIISVLLSTVLASGLVYANTTDVSNEKNKECGARSQVMDKSYTKHTKGDYVKRLTKKLNLDAEQVTKIQAISDKYKPQLSEIRSKARGNREQIRELVDKGELNEGEVRSLAVKYGANKADMMVLRIKMKAEIKHELNSEQQEKLNQIRQERRRTR